MKAMVEGGLTSFVGKVWASKQVQGLDETGGVPFRESDLEKETQGRSRQRVCISAAKSRRQSLLLAVRL